MMYKLGKKPARPDSIKFKLINYLSLPTPPKKAGHQSLVMDWEGMLGNDKWGNCVLAGADHETILWGKEGDLNVTFTEQNVLSDYSAITGFNPLYPETDKGTDMQVAASYRRKTGVIDASGKRHKVGAYVSISLGDVRELKQAIYLFGAVGVGFQFPDYAMDEFNAGQTWHLKSGGTIQGGHYVPAVGYDSRYLYVVSWGRIVKMSYGFYRKYADEVIAYISPEMLTGGKSLEGFSLVQLQSDLSQLS